MVLEILSNALWFVGVPVIRSFAGWIENAFQDKKISSYEWSQLGETVLRVGVLGIATWLGLNGAGVEVSAGASGGIAAVLDFVLSKVKSMTNK